MGHAHFYYTSYSEFTPLKFTQPGTAWVDVDGFGQDDIRIYDGIDGSSPSFTLYDSDNPRIAWVENPGPNGDIHYLRWSDVVPTPTATPIPEGVILVYPNPFDSNKAFGGTLKFKGLPKGSKIEIYTVSLESVKELKEENGEASWDGRNKSGAMVAVGTYCYLVKKDKAVLKRGNILVRK